ncbi:Ser-tRNA(Thr) hydrolase [Saccharolobus solfataricus]|uniref:Threonine--tRNA ligase editing subunit n=3 Tax=Saccharolobus solfataricus TaxID=2287 RepID=SYTE_SACS2|nr:threonyl-tRNA synthetase editing domain-containing protein [Saccharolobus solfataricus]Q980D1.1 RecName: Full=Threonine--tRNA ligase editing subunit; AltName: Full=Ser-tRNA(Thr) hydrolase; AltName: Full=Threonyl-tRNA synthetase editing subunit; Short=ThrS-ed [Saccharolobus solfataricus P2]AAK40712.1 Threonyl-tRNA synthetase homolog (thrS-like) [Saccharolobus solfataricus P2]AKA73689.1 Ser-tRNA(Thr) hydrolase [Saccharolobus solfataricus]AKA76386.1 Ser-tRNA(Thr) hydrolase [Saccharolobus solfat
MIILFIHASDFSFNVKERAIKEPEEAKLKSIELKNTLVCFTTVEKGDDEEILSKAIDDILDVYSKVKADSVVIYPYAHLSSNLANPDTAIKILESLENLLKDKVKVYRAPFGWYKAFSISCYGHPLSELSRRIRKTEELEKSEELKYCEKFGFPSSSESAFMRRATIGYLRNLFQPLFESENNENVRDGEMSILYQNVESGRILPCINENPRIVVVYGGVRELNFPKEINDSKNRIRVWWVNESKIYVDVGRLIYYFILESVKQQPPTLPDWLNPIQVRLLPVKKDFLDFSIQVAERLRKEGIRVNIDDLDDSLGNKIRRAGTDWIPFVIVIGEREVKTNTLTVKIRARNEQKSMTVEELVKEIKDEVKERQNLPLYYTLYRHKNN